MGRIFGGIIVLLCCIILPVAASQAKTHKEVYLKDGGIIECQKVWQANGKVLVLVNRDTLVDFSRDEVDLRKTFPPKPVKGVKKGKIRKKVVSKPGAVMPQAVPQPPAKPGMVNAGTQKAGMAPTAKPVPPASPQPAVPTAKSAAQAEKPSPATTKPASPVVAQLPAIKPPVQGTATSVKKPAPAGAAPLVRTTLPVAKLPESPPPKPSFLASNMVNIALVALLVLLVAGYVIYKKRQ
jgi:hypothetical protein